VNNVRETEADLKDDDLDLRFAASMDFSANKFQREVERLYMGVVRRVPLNQLWIPAC
jgi:hypothetical protein